MSTAAPVADPGVTEIDLADTDHWRDGPPYALFDQIREHDPVHWSPQRNRPEEGGFWSITRWDHMREATRRFDTFSSEKRGIFLVDDTGVILDVQRQQMISMDPPRHDRLKKLVGKAFTPRRIAEHEQAVRQIIGDVLDRAEAEAGPGGEIDLVKHVARPVPGRVIGSLIGTPPEDDEKWVHWSNVAAAFEDPEIRKGWKSTEEELMDLIQYTLARKQERVDEPRSDLLSALIAAQVDGESLNDLELTTFLLLLMTAGNDSTRSTYTSTIRALLQDPEQLALVRDDPTLVVPAVEEGLRCFPAFGHMGRAATHDVEFGGKQIKEGDRVLLWYIATNRDPAVFPDPGRYDLRRENLDQHQAFGAGGRHFCLGASLARLELRLWIEETLRRWPSLELAGEGTRIQSLFLNQWATLPVKLG